MLGQAYQADGGHKHFEIATRTGGVELIDELEVRSLDMVVSSCTRFEPGALDGVGMACRPREAVSCHPWVCRSKIAIAIGLYNTSCSSDSKAGQPC